MHPGAREPPRPAPCLLRFRELGATAPGPPRLVRPPVPLPPGKATSPAPQARRHQERPRQSSTPVQRDSTVRSALTFSLSPPPLAAVGSNAPDEPRPERNCFLNNSHSYYARRIPRLPSTIGSSPTFLAAKTRHQGDRVPCPSLGRPETTRTGNALLERLGLPRTELYCNHPPAVPMARSFP